MSPTSSPTRSRGLTLIEMLITLGIIGILAFMAVPALIDTLGRMATNAAARAFTNTLSLARSESVKRSRNILICPSISGTDCAAGSWASGWILFIDANGDANGASGSVDAGDTVLRAFDPLADMTMTSSPANTNLLSYDNKGYGRMGSVVTFKICPEDGNSSNARSVEISVSGRARTITSGVTCS